MKRKIENISSPSKKIKKIKCVIPYSIFIDIFSFFYFGDSLKIFTKNLNLFLIIMDNFKEFCNVYFKDKSMSYTLMIKIFNIFPYFTK